MPMHKDQMSFRRYRYSRRQAWAGSCSPCRVLRVYFDPLKMTFWLTYKQHNSYTVVDTKGKVADMVNTLTALPIDEPNIGIDLEGKNLGRDGPLYILIIHDYKAEHTYIVDVHTLQLEAFNTCGADEEKNLRSILESAETSKLIYDVRQDSEALYHQFKIRLDGILDVQLFKLADMSRSFESPARYRPGLYRAICYGIGMTIEVRNKWFADQERG